MEIFGTYKPITYFCSEILNTIGDYSMTKLQFTKMHGCGNDYIYIDCLSNDVGKNFLDATSSISKLAVRLSDRHKGIGSDGLVFILPSATAELRMRMFNADGTEAEMCGNAARCVGKYAYEHHMTDKTDFTLETKAGIKTVHLNTRQGQVIDVSINMGIPAMGPQTGYEEYKLHCVDMGNPHAVIFVEDLSKIDVKTLGSAIECLPIFPQKTNVEFAEVLTSDEIRLRVWERGTGETLACGTGACATAVAAYRAGFTTNNVTIHLLGGDLHVCQDSKTGEILLTGDAEEVFFGEITL